MLEINYNKLQIINNDVLTGVSTVLNITGDFAPSLGCNSNILINKKEKYYTDLITYFKMSDLNIVNLEMSIDVEKRYFLKSGIRLVDKPEILQSLKSINTNLVCLANNHIMDNGKIGLKKTIEYLEDSNINYIGAGLKITDIYKPFSYKNKINRIVIINTAEGEEANEKYNNHYGSSDIESYRVIDQIRQAKIKGFFVILVAHAGVEFIPTPPPHIQDLFRNFVDEGVDLLVGHHPHVPQGFEIYKDVPIFYSLGNFSIHRQVSRDMEKVGFFLNIEICNNKLKIINLLPYQIKRDELSLLKGDYYMQFVKLIKKSSDHIKKNDDLHLIWNEYINLRKPILDFLKIIRMYKFNSYSSFLCQFNFTTQYSRRFMFLPQVSILKSFKYYDYLKDFGVPKRLNICQKFFLFNMDRLFMLGKSISIIKSYLKKVKNKIGRTK